MADYNNNFTNNEYFKMFQNYALPQPDFSGFFALQRRNLEAFSAANQALSEGTQQIARRSAEFLRENVETALNASRDLMTTTTPDTNASKQSDYAKNTSQKYMNQMREISELATRAQQQAFDIISKRMTQSADEARSYSDKATKKTAA